MHQMPFYSGRLKPVALLVKYACYAIGHDWRVANGLPVDQ
jgi:hypothetical protein